MKVKPQFSDGLDVVGEKIGVKSNFKFLFWTSGRIELPSTDIGKTMVEQL